MRQPLKLARAGATVALALRRKSRKSPTRRSFPSTPRLRAVRSPPCKARLGLSRSPHRLRGADEPRPPPPVEGFLRTVQPGDRASLPPCISRVTEPCCACQVSESRGHPRALVTLTPSSSTMTRTFFILTGALASLALAGAAGSTHQGHPPTASAPEVTPDPPDAEHGGDGLGGLDVVGSSRRLLQAAGIDWAVVLKTNGDDTFQYDSDYWTSSTNVLNEGSDPSQVGNAKYAEYNSMPFNAVRACVGTLDNCLEHMFAETYDNAVQLFDGAHLREGIDQALFENLFGASGHQDCDPQRPAFNTQCNDGNSARWGFCANIPSQACQSLDTNDADGVIGFGLKGQDCCTMGAGWTNYFVSNTPNGGDESRHQAWILVGELVCTAFSTTYSTTPGGYIVPNADATTVSGLGTLACASGYEGTPAVTCDGTIFSAVSGCQTCTPFSTTYPRSPDGYIVTNTDATTVAGLGTLACGIGFEGGTPVATCDGTTFSFSGCEVRTNGVPLHWPQVAMRYCNTAGDIASYATVAEALAACEADATCLYISDSGCNNLGFWETCSTDGASSSVGSCLYEKVTDAPICEPFSTSFPTTPAGYILPNVDATIVPGLGRLECAKGWVGTPSTTCDGATFSALSGCTYYGSVPFYWPQVAGRYCSAVSNGMIASYSTVAEAVAACEDDTSCLYISDRGCDGAWGGWNTCNTNGVASEDWGASSCMYEKVDGTVPCTMFSATFPEKPDGYIVPNADATTVDGLGALACASGYAGAPVVACDITFSAPSGCQTCTPFSTSYPSTPDGFVAVATFSALAGCVIPTYTTLENVFVGSDGACWGTCGMMVMVVGGGGDGPCNDGNSQCCHGGQGIDGKMACKCNWGSEMLCGDPVCVAFSATYPSTPAGYIVPNIATATTVAGLGDVACASGYEPVGFSQGSPTSEIVTCEGSTFSATGCEIIPVCVAFSSTYPDTPTGYIVSNVDATTVGDLGPTCTTGYVGNPIVPCDGSTFTSPSGCWDTTVTVPSYWPQVAGRYCNAAIETYSTVAEAVATCVAEATCLFVFDISCDGAGDWYTCNDEGLSSASHCMYEKADEPVCTPFSTTYPTVPDGYVVPNVDATTVGGLGTLACASGYENVLSVHVSASGVPAYTTCAGTTFSALSGCQTCTAFSTTYPSRPNGYIHCAKCRRHDRKWTWEPRLCDWLRRHSGCNGVRRKYVLGLVGMR